MMGDLRWARILYFYQIAEENQRFYIIRLPCSGRVRCSVETVQNWHGQSIFSDVKVFTRNQS